MAKVLGGTLGLVVISLMLASFALELRLYWPFLVFFLLAVFGKRHGIFAKRMLDELKRLPPNFAKIVIGGTNGMLIVMKLIGML